MLVGGAGGGLEGGGVAVGAVGGEDQAEEGRLGGGELDVAEAGGDEAVGLRQAALAGALGGEEAAEALGGEGGEEGAGVGEVVRGGGVADAGALGDAAEREALDAAEGELGLGGGEEGLAQVAVVVAAGLGRRGFGGGTGVVMRRGVAEAEGDVEKDLDSGKIASRVS